MNVVILAPGSRGDVQPYIALGQGLRALGHHCSIVTTLDHELLVRSYGLDVVTIDVNVAEELRRVETHRAVEGGGVVASFRQFAAIAKRSARELASVGLATCRSSDVLVTNFSTALIASGISQALHIPLVQAFNVPVTSTGTFPGALFPGLDFGPTSRKLGHALTRTALWMTARSAANQACMEVMGAPSAPLSPPRHAGLLPGRVLYGFSQAFLPRPSDWGEDAQVTGFWFVEEPKSFEPPAELVRFLEQGPPPVCVGFGSMSTEEPEAVSAMVLEAARTARVRLVLLSGWAGLQAGKLSEEVMVLQGAPHSWLYPRCRAVVHHGGAGTTAAAVQAGVPAVVVPFHGDQPFWAAHVCKLGLGPAPIPRRKLTAKRLSDAIGMALTNGTVQERAAELGRRVRAEHGVMVAAAAIADAPNGV